MRKPDVLTRVKQYYQDYGRRAKDLRNAGLKIIGYFCSLTPVELITAAGFVPFRLRGDVKEPITEGDTELESIACPFVRSCFDLSLKRRYDFCDGLVVPHACDSITKAYPVWRDAMRTTHSHFINLPHKATDSSIKFFKNELETFKKWLEKLSQKAMSDEALEAAVGLHDENRRKVRSLYQLRKADPPLISGTEMNMIMVAGMGLPVYESSELFDEVLRTVKGTKKGISKRRPRIIVSGPCLDHVGLIGLIESAGADVVVDDLCMGTRDCWRETKPGDDILWTVADLYLGQIHCSRTYREYSGESLGEKMESRFGEIGSFINDFRVDGAILFTYRFCDPFGFDVPAKKEYFSSLHIPALFIEDGYGSGDAGRLQTRIQAFLEMIGDKNG